MAIFIAVVKEDGEAGYSASFPDYPTCVVAARTVDEAIAGARAALLAHLVAGQKVCAPMPADSIARNGALLLAAIDVPDDVRTVRVELEMPALSLARLEALARRHGLTLSALFVVAADRWAIEASLTPRSAVDRHDIILPDFDNPLELKMDAIAVTGPAQLLSAVDQSIVTEQGREVTADIAAELARMLEEHAVSDRPNGGENDPGPHQRPLRRRG
jgi:predicted RNase H-like HicB family nuclease